MAQYNIGDRPIVVELTIKFQSGVPGIDSTLRRIEYSQSNITTT